MSELSVELQKTISAPVEKVFNAWLDASMLTQFMMPMKGMPQPRTEAEGKEGGRFVVYMQVGEDEIPHQGTYLEVKPNEKLVFTWDSPFSVSGSTVTIDFSVVEGNKTHLNFRHVKFSDEETRNNHDGGWQQILENLSLLTTGSEQNVSVAMNG